MGWAKINFGCAKVELGSRRNLTQHYMPVASELEQYLYSTLTQLCTVRATYLFHTHLTVMASLPSILGTKLGDGTFL